MRIAARTFSQPSARPAVKGDVIEACGRGAGVRASATALRRINTVGERAARGIGQTDARGAGIPLAAPGAHSVRIAPAGG
jgi:hypothetical protein